MTNLTNDHAVAAFVDATDRLAAVVSALHAATAAQFDHVDPDAINYGHVGTVTETARQLEETLAFLTGGAR